MSNPVLKVLSISMLLCLSTALATKQDCYDAFDSNDFATAAVECAGPAKAGDAYSQFAMGYMTDAGEGFKENNDYAMTWYALAAEQGQPDAMNNLADMYYNGDGIKKDLAEAFFWYNEAAKLGQMYAQAALGIMYYRGDGVAKNAKNAAYWFKLGADQGVTYAQYYIGIMYRDGVGVAENLDLAFAYLQKAAKGGSEDAKKALIEW